MTCPTCTEELAPIPKWTNPQRDRPYTLGDMCRGEPCARGEEYRCPACNIVWLLLVLYPAFGSARRPGVAKLVKKETRL